MRRNSFFRYLAYWTEGAERSSAGRRPRPLCPGPTAVRFTPDQLDELSEILALCRDTTPVDRPSTWHDDDAASVDRQARFFRAVDRAIAEIATSRRRSKGFHALASFARYRRPRGPPSTLVVEFEPDLAAVPLEPGVEAVAGPVSEAAEQGVRPCPSRAWAVRTPIDLPAIVFHSPDGGRDSRAWLADGGRR